MVVEHFGVANSDKVYKAGDTVTYVAEFKQDVDSRLAMTAWLDRIGGPDESGLTWEIYLQNSQHVGPRHIEVSGVMGGLANGHYKPVRVDLNIGGVTKTLSTNLDPDGDAVITVAGNTGPSFPELVDFDPKH
ncbi:MAG: hypothetical protein JWM87_3746 [Candidatus Eremiobacteraeota bacterium]|nr:hypothetical protein [Candidatus Eremiobacteraeota bacterium]